MLEDNSQDIESSEEEELFEHHKYKVDKKQELLRIDKFLIDRIPNTSRNRIQNAAKSGNILVDGKIVKPNYKVKPGEEISIVLPYPPREVELIAEDIPLEILHEDNDVLVINKEAGLVVHPGFGNYTGTLVNALIYHFENLPTQDGPFPRPGLVHRLDKNTSGIMVVAKTDEALTHLANQFFNKTSQRTYQAIVWGDVLEDEGTITGYIGRSQKDRKIMHIYDDEEKGKISITHYKVIRRYGYITHVECKLETGRTHQIRAHFKYIGHPLFNDTEYGGNRIVKGTTFTKYKQFVQNCFSICQRHALHAKTLGFKHPSTGKFLEFDSDLPDDMKQLLQKWEVYSQSR